MIKLFNVNQHYIAKNRTVSYTSSDINECESNPCTNPSVPECVDMPNGYICQECPAGYTGEDCSEGRIWYIELKIVFTFSVLIILGRIQFWIPVRPSIFLIWIFDSLAVYFYKIVIYSVHDAGLLKHIRVYNSDIISSWFEMVASPIQQ